MTEPPFAKVCNCRGLTFRQLCRICVCERKRAVAAEETCVWELEQHFPRQ